MKTTIKIIVTICLLKVSVSNAQNEVDALRYSQTTISGTARYNGMAGAYTALGGDITSINQNPAGLAVYRRNEVVGGLNFVNSAIQSNYNDTRRENYRSNMGINNVGFLFNNTIQESKYGWVSNYIAFSYNQTNNFYTRTSIEGVNGTNSMLTYLVDKANNGNGTPVGNLDRYSILAFDSYLMDTLPGSTNKYFGLFSDGGVTQSKIINTSGKSSDASISFGGNYKDKLFLGAAASVSSVKYSESTIYSEEDTKDTLDYLKSFELRDNFSTSGYGYNLKVGFIYKPVDWLRLGASVITPTLLNLSDSYSTSISSVWDSISMPEKSAPNGEFDYKLYTPLRANAGIGFIIGKQGIISADYEYIDYTSASLFSNDDAFSSANAGISSKYQKAGNVKIGGEMRLEPFVLRGGYGLYSNPYKTGVNRDASRTYYTGGVGYRQENLFMDVALVVMSYKENYYLYNKAYVNPAELTKKQANITFTIGYKF